MEKMLKQFGFEVIETKDGEGDQGPIGIIEGYASTFGNVDLGGDVIQAGAFSKTIQETKGVWPILLDHNPRTPVGYNVEASEDKKGLKTRSEILLITDEAKNRYELAKLAAKHKTKMGMSIGFSLVKWAYDKEGAVRNIQEVKMWEHSLVTFPMNPKATVSGVKELSDEQLEQVIKMLKRAGYGLKEINSALGLVAPKSAAGQDTDPELLQSLANLTASLQA
jgi:HK97 family phage prohead protease